MTTAHKIYISGLSLIVIITFSMLLLDGLSYYETPLEERFFHEGHESLKPSGIMGHGLGIAGSLAMLLGVVLYILRKRSRTMARMGLLKHWLEFHIFLCTLGPIMVLYHTAFKFGGIVSVSFWSMVAVFLSGIVGRFIYIHIPRNLEGRLLSMEEISKNPENTQKQLERIRKMQNLFRYWHVAHLPFALVMLIIMIIHVIITITFGYKWIF